MFLGANNLLLGEIRGSEKARERKSQGAKEPGSELMARILLADLLHESVLARERKGCESADARLLTRTHISDAELMRYIHHRFKKHHLLR